MSRFMTPRVARVVGIIDPIENKYLRSCEFADGEVEVSYQCGEDGVDDGEVDRSAGDGPDCE